MKKEKKKSFISNKNKITSVSLTILSVIFLFLVISIFFYTFVINNKTSSNDNLQGNLYNSFVSPVRSFLAFVGIKNLDENIYDKTNNVMYYGGYGCGDGVIQTGEECDNSDGTTGKGNDDKSCGSESGAIGDVVCNKKNYAANPYNDKSKTAYCTTNCKNPKCTNPNEVKCKACESCGSGISITCTTKSPKGWTVIDILTTKEKLQAGITYSGVRIYNVYEDYYYNVNISDTTAGTNPSGDIKFTSSLNKFILTPQGTAGSSQTLEWKITGSNEGTFNVKISSSLILLKDGPNGPIFKVLPNIYYVYNIKFKTEDDTGKCIPDCSKDGITCLTKTGSAGYCKKGICETGCLKDTDCPRDNFCFIPTKTCYPKTCVNMFGPDQKQCGRATNGKLNCCGPKDPTTGLGGCCEIQGFETATDYVPPCCYNNEKCSGINYDATNSISRLLPYCKPQGCNDPNKVLVCPADSVNLNFCCDKGDICLTFNNPKPLSPFPILTGPFNPLNLYTAICGKPGCSADETPCPNGPNNPSGPKPGDPTYNGQITGDGVQCCKNSIEVCKRATTMQYPIPLCVAKNVDRPGYTYCPGVGENWGWAARWCRNGYEICVTQGQSGQPTCEPMQQEMGNPAIPQSNSMYLVRNSNDFQVNGKAYVIKPHMIFNNSVEIYFDYTNYSNGEYLQTYKFNDSDSILSGCNSTLLNSTDKIVYPGIGGVIEFDEMRFVIPEESLNDPVNFTVEEYDLQDCYKPEENLIDKLGTIFGNLESLGKEDFTSCYNSSNDPIHICNCIDLQRINENLGSNFILNNTIDCSETSNWIKADCIAFNKTTCDNIFYNSQDCIWQNGECNSVVGFKALINMTRLPGEGLIEVFSGNLDGQGYKISNLTGETLISYNYYGKISNLRLVDANLSGLGSIANINYGVIENCSSSGILAQGKPITDLGWLEDINENCLYVGTDLTIGDSPGGLVGLNQGNIKNSFTEGFVTGEYQVGGLVGWLNGNITNSHSNATVNGTFNIGGLVGLGWGINSTIQDSFFTGVVYANRSAGGIVAFGQGGLIINNSFSTGKLYTNNLGGGLIGYPGGEDCIATVIGNSYWLIRLNGPRNCTGVGEIIGCNVNDSEKYFYSTLNEPLKSWDYGIWSNSSDGISYPELKPLINLIQNNETNESDDNPINPIISPSDGSSSSGASGSAIKKNNTVKLIKPIEKQDNLTKVNNDSNIIIKEKPIFYNDDTKENSYVFYIVVIVLVIITILVGIFILKKIYNYKKKK